MTVFAMSNQLLAFIVIPGWIIMGVGAMMLEEWWESRRKK